MEIILTFHPGGFQVRLHDMQTGLIPNAGDYVAMEGGIHRKITRRYFSFFSDRKLGIDFATE
jgi:hypothetical protein